MNCFHFWWIGLGKSLVCCFPNWNSNQNHYIFFSKFLYSPIEILILVKCWKFIFLNLSKSSNFNNPVDNFLFRWRSFFTSLFSHVTQLFYLINLKNIAISFDVPATWTTKNRAADECFAGSARQQNDAGGIPFSIITYILIRAIWKMRFSSRTAAAAAKRIYSPRALSFSLSSAEAQSKLIAFDLKRNLPRHLFVSSGAKSGLNATHAHRRRRTMGHYFEYTGRATLIAPPLSCTQYTDPSEVWVRRLISFVAINQPSGVGK